MCALEDDQTELQMMQDWLILHKLDRKVLANLAFNLSQVEAYDAYVAHEVKATLEGIVQAVITSDQPIAQDAVQTMQQAPLAQSEEQEQGISLFLYLSFAVLWGGAFGQSTWSYYPHFL